MYLNIFYIFYISVHIFSNLFLPNRKYMYFVLGIIVGDTVAYYCLFVVLHELTNDVKQDIPGETYGIL